MFLKLFLKKEQLILPATRFLQEMLIKIRTRPTCLFINLLSIVRFSK